MSSEFEGATPTAVATMSVTAPVEEAAEGRPRPELSPAEIPELESSIVEALKKVYDPEIPVDIYELGLIYDIDIRADRHVHLKMTLTAPGCPVAGSLPGEVRNQVATVAGVADAEVELVWDPPWNPAMMSEAARLTLGMF